MRLFFPLSLLVASSLLACGGGGGGSDGPRAPVKVMTRNLFLGAELGDVIRAPTGDEVERQVAALWKSVEEGDVPGRLGKVADEIAAARPDLVGLQEVELFYRQSPSDFDFMAPTKNASTLVHDFLQILRDGLAARGADYQVVYEQRLSDAEMPGRTEAGERFDLRMVDRDVILARAGVTVSNVRAKQFETHVTGFRIAGLVPLEIQRGVGFLDATVGGARFTFGVSHLEVGEDLLRAYQEAQARELAKQVDGLSGPLVLVGDFNSAADGKGTASYGILTGGGKLHDAYATLRPGDPGLTCCTDITASTFMASTRIDLVLTKGDVRATAADIVGTSAEERTGAAVWPSDHAGLVMGLSLPARP